MDKLIALTLCLLLVGCTTPQTVLKSKTGQVVTCGGNVTSSLSGGVIGYYIQANNDKKCVENYKKHGFKVDGN